MYGLKIIPMEYFIEFKKRAVKDLQKIPEDDAIRLLSKIYKLKKDLKGDVKKLTNHTPEYRLRVGNFRILFEIIGNRVIIYRVRHRKKAYN